MEPLLTVAETRLAESVGIETFGLPELLLMEHAALGLVDALERRFGPWLPETKGIIVAGCGNNGGDACAAARILRQRGCRQLVVVLVGEPARATKSLAFQLSVLGKIGIPIVSNFSDDFFRDGDWILDGLFGLGMSRPPEGDARLAIESIARVASERYVLAADVPSGLCADTGQPLGVAVPAAATVTFGFCKRGLVTGRAADFVGELQLAPLGFPTSVVPVGVETFLFTASDARLPKRRPAGHKGDFGTVHVVLGDPSMHGAALLVAMGALRCGAGRAALLGDSTALEAARPRAIPEIMLHPLDGALPAAKETVVVVGPGLGRGEGGKAQVAAALRSAGPVVLDADALFLLEDGDLFDALLRRKVPTVLLPHPKEAARLLAWTVEEVERDRFATIAKLTDKFRCTVLLKGRGTLVRGTTAPCFVVGTGTTALAKGGSGDLLAGVVAAFLAQGLAPATACATAAYVHGRAAERWSARGNFDGAAFPSDIAALLPEVLAEMAQAATAQAPSGSQR